MRIKSNKKRRLSFLAARRQLERTRLSFLLVLFFFGLFGIIIVMEGFTETKSKKILKQNEGDSKETDAFNTNNGDLWYEQQSVFKALSHIVPNVTNKQATLPISNLFNGSTMGNTKTTNSLQNSNRKIPISDWQVVHGSPEKFYVYSAYYIPKPA